ncbi:MAG: hypothetical protein ABSB40_04355 [Nitrososphaeria archaeon]
MRSGLILTGALVCLLALTVVPMVSATSNNGLKTTSPVPPPATIELPMKINNTWGEFFWESGTTLSPLPGTWWADQIVSVNVPYAMVVNITVTDAFAAGDNFEVWEVNGISPTTGTLIGTTPHVPDNYTIGISDPNLALINPAYSHASFIVDLTPGTYYFAFREVSHSIEGGGGAFVKFSEAMTIGGYVLPTGFDFVPIVALLGIFGVATVVVGTRKERKL